MFEVPEKLPNWFNKKIEVRQSPEKGLGVFATERIEKHEIFERAPVLVFSPALFKVLKNSYEFQGRDHTLMSYTFNWSEGNCAVVWGYGSLYNHGNGELSCASYRMQLKIPCVEYFAKRVIEPGEEILIHYLRGKGDVEFCDDGTWLQSDGVVDKVPFRRSSAGGRLTALDADWHDSN